MGEAPPAVFSLSNPARVLVPLASEKVLSKWVVATNALRENNEVLVASLRA